MKSLNQLSESEQIRVLQLFGGEASTEEIARHFGISAQSIRRRAARLNIRKGHAVQNVVGEQTQESNLDVSRHLEIRKRQRRGYWIPSELEQTYCNLLLEGMTRRQAGEMLGLAEIGDDNQGVTQ